MFQNRACFFLKTNEIHATELKANNRFKFDQAYHLKQTREHREIEENVEVAEHVV